MYDEHVAYLEDGEDDELEEGDGGEGREERLQHGAQQQVRDAEERVQNGLLPDRQQRDAGRGSLQVGSSRSRVTVRLRAQLRALEPNTGLATGNACAYNHTMGWDGD